MELLPMPKSFDQNEIFALLITCCLIIIFIILPKRFPIHLLILFLLINSFIGRTVDTALAIPPFDIYDSFDANKHELLDEITYSIVYPIYGYVFYYFYDKFYLIPTWMNVLTWALMSTIFERISVYFNVFHYHKWHIFYSFLVYILVYLLHIKFYRLMTKQLNYTSKRVQSVRR